MTELRNRNNILEKKIEEAESSASEIKLLQEELGILATLNKALGNEGDELRKKLEVYDKYQMPSQDSTNVGSGIEEESSKRSKSKKKLSKKQDTSSGSSTEEEHSRSKKSKLSRKAKGKRIARSVSRKAKGKRRSRSGGKRKTQHNDEESSSESDSDDSDEPHEEEIEKNARVCNFV